VESNEYLETFLVVEDAKENRFYLHEPTLSDLSSREIGYRIGEIINCQEITFPSPFGGFDDLKLFDLIELLIIFTKDKKRKKFISEIQRIFNEDGQDFILHNYMISKKSESGIRSIMPLLKDKKLKEFLESYIKLSRAELDYKNLARLSADIMQRIFSSPSTQKETKEYSERLCDKVALRWTSKSKASDLSNLLSNSVKESKLFNNMLSDIRHSDKYTVPIASPSLYKLVAQINISIAELFILSLLEEFIAEQNPSVIKNSYLKWCKVEKDSTWKKNVRQEQEEEEIDVKDIPF
jgi:hypothetical protein